MDETIKVNYEYLGSTPKGTPYYHTTTVYTDFTGAKFISSGYATGNGSSDSKISVASAIFDTGTAGKLKFTSGSVTDQDIINVWGADKLAVLLHEDSNTVTEATSSVPNGLQGYWNGIVQTHAEITASQRDYNPVDLNSNSGTETGLVSVGLPPLQNGGWNGTHPTPGSDHVLGTSNTTETTPERDTYTDPLGNTVYSYVAPDENGATTTLAFNAGADSIGEKTVEGNGETIITEDRVAPDDTVYAEGTSDSYGGDVAYVFEGSNASGSESFSVHISTAGGSIDYQSILGGSYLHGSDDWEQQGAALLASFGITVTSSGHVIYHPLYPMANGTLPTGTQDDLLLQEPGNDPRNTVQGARDYSPEKTIALNAVADQTLVLVQAMAAFNKNEGAMSVIASAHLLPHEHILVAH